MATQTNLSGKVVVITGASSGFGRGAALEFANEGASVVLAARRGEALDTVARECEIAGGTAIPVPVDVSSERDVEQLAETAISGGFAYGNYGGVTPEGRRYEGASDEGANYPRPRVSNRGRGPRGYQRADERIREDVCERLTDDEHIDASDIEVTVANCEVTLSGTLRSRNAKRRSEHIAELVRGVKDVHNLIRVVDEQTRQTDVARNTGMKV